MASRDGMDGDLDDDFTLEVSDLRTGQVMETGLTSSELGASPSVDADEDELSITPLDAPVATRRSPPRSLGQARTQSIVVIGLALAACLAILLNLPGIQQGLGEAFDPATPTAEAPIASGGDLLYFVNIVPWGTLKVDGKTIPFFGDSTIATLARGRHRVQFSGPPFATMRCVVSIPADAQHDTCPLVASNATIETTSDEPDTRYIDMGETPGKLPSGTYNELLDTVSAALAASPITTNVASGDHYLGAHGAVVATEPLVASLTLDVNIDAARPFPDGLGGDSCVSFCDSGQTAGNGQWSLAVHVLAQWHFSTASGAYVPSADTATDTSFDVSVQWGRGGWRLEPFTVADELNNFCGDTLFDVPIVPNALTPGTTPSSQTTNTAPSALDGCAMRLSVSADAALYIYHYGVLLAASNLAHTWQPQLPIATDSERALALQWLKPYL